MKKQPEITDATREAFVTAFFRLAKIKNIHQITVREITNLAGYNRTTFYRYFEDIYALIEYEEDKILQNTRIVLEEQYGSTAIGERQFFETVIQCFQENKERVSILLSEQNRSHFLRRIEENIANHLQRFGSDNPKKRVVRDIYFYGIFHAISVNLQSRNALSDEDLLDIIQKLFDNWYRPQMMEEQ
ncbi:MAG: TetR/AcrR family transcriptional regulator [Clostridiales bacterium]|nr:TetR/AcrR family transcriptional regulator [Clostridiales bacterium]